MRSRRSDWRKEIGRFLKQFFGERCAPCQRWSVVATPRAFSPMVERLAGDYEFAAAMRCWRVIAKKGTLSVGIAAQYASALGKTTQAYPTLARGEVPIMLTLRLFLPESWTSDTARLKHADTESGNVGAHMLSLLDPAVRRSHMNAHP
jgi:DDE superfamily endonuclease